MTNDSKIIPMREPRAKRLRRALDAWQAATAQWIEYTLELAAELKAARDDCGSDDRRFGVWLADNNCDDLGRDARAAFIHMGEHIELARDVLRLTERKSIELIWERELKPIVDQRHLSERSDTSVVVHNIVPDSETATVSPEKSETTVSDKAPKERFSPVQPRETDPLSDMRRVGEVFAIFTQQNTRGTLRKLKGKHSLGQIWKLILTALDAGLLQPTHTKIEQPNLRFLFPLAGGRYCGKFDLTDTKTREHVRDVLLPLMIQHKDVLFANPDGMEQILEGAQRKQVADQRAATVQQRTVKALATLPSGESEVIMFGKRMWPIVEGETIGAYDFRTLQVAVWKFTDLNRWMHRDSPLTRAINIRNSTKWDRHFIGELLKDSGDLRFKIDRIYQLVHAITLLMTENPDGECKEPLTPLVLG
jgi:hypothetical protein